MSSALLLRADASAAIGSGHVMRCLALAQEWRRGGGRAVFLQTTTTPALTRRLEAAGCEVELCAAAPGGAEDAAATIRAAHACGAAWVVGDGYHFDSAWQRPIRGAGLRLLLLDDYGHAGHYHADFVLNQNVSADPTLYTRRDAETRLLLGPQFALLRQEFVAAVLQDRTVWLPGRVLVTLGGSDSANVTRLVIEALAAFDDLEAVVVIGAGNPHRVALQSMVNALAKNIRLEVNPPNMAALMRWADLAITAGGSTVWEIARLGLPALTIVTAKNQAAIARALHAHGSVVNLGEPSDLSAHTIAGVLRGLRHDPVRLENMSRLGRQLVDGRGAERVVAALEACA